MAEELENQKEAQKPSIPTKIKGRSPLYIGGKGTLASRAIGALEYRATIIVGKAKEYIAYELESALAFNLVPVFLSIGILTYFYAPFEPIAPLVVAATVFLLALLLRATARGLAYHLIFFGTFLCVGMMIAQFSTFRAGAPQLPKQITAQIVGTVVDVQQNRRGSPRYMLNVHSIDKLEHHEQPETVRLSAASGERFLPGDIITGLARIQPVSGPVLAGSYDFSFFAWYSKLGGSGFFMGAPQGAQIEHDLGVVDGLTIMINRARAAIAERIRANIKNKNAGVIVALVTGDKTGIDQTDQEALRASGLAHILAISGLHMALIALTAAWFVRLCFVNSTDLTSRISSRKIATLVGLLVATVYLGLSGAGIATQRAWVVIAVMSLSVMLDRKAITLRSVAISASIILAISPESLFQPGFQMSFCAVIALVSGYEAIRRKRETAATHKRDGLFFDAGRFIGALAMTSLIAGSATLLIAAYHFHQIATLGLVANVLAMPIVTLILMPFILISVLLMPFGWEAVALTPVDWAVDWVVGIATGVSSISPYTITGVIPISAMTLFTIGFLLVTLLKTPLRYGGLLALFLISFFITSPPKPELIIAENGRAVGMLNAEQDFVVAFPSRQNFVTEIWAKAYSDGRFQRAGLDKDICNKERCVLEMKGNKTAHIVYKPELLESSCALADILIAPRLKWVRCREKKKPDLILKRHDFEQYGAHMIYRTEARPETEWTVKTALPEPTRPWHRRVKAYDD